MRESDFHSTFKMLDSRGRTCLEIWESCGHLALRLSNQLSTVELAFTEGESKELYDFIRKFAKRHWTGGKPW